MLLSKSRNGFKGLKICKNLARTQLRETETEHTFPSGTLALSSQHSLLIRFVPLGIPLSFYKAHVNTFFSTNVCINVLRK